MSTQTDLHGTLPDWMTQAQKDALYSLAARSHGVRHEMDVIEDILRRLEPRTPRYDRYLETYNRQRERLLGLKARMAEISQPGAPAPAGRFWA